MAFRGWRLGISRAELGRSWGGRPSRDNLRPSHGLHPCRPTCFAALSPMPSAWDDQLSLFGARFYAEPVPWAYPAPLDCGGLDFLPISFAIPQEDVVPCVPQKLTDVAHLVPGRPETYIFPMTAFGELEYKRMYREARFARKVRRGGWETMRIYEILASGSVPYIEKVDDIPESALVFVNKSLLRLRKTSRNGSK